MDRLNSLAAFFLCLGVSAFIPPTLFGQPVQLSARQQIIPSPPPLLILPAGTVIRISASEILSSDMQQTGDTFVAELQNPLVVDGWVVARAGQTVVGRIVSTRKAGRVKGTSNISLELERLVLVDGYQASLVTELVEYAGPSSHGRDLAAVAITTGAGAAIGSVCGARGAAIGAAIGATTGFAGVLLTRGEKVEIRPEERLTFRLATPLSVSTSVSRHSFWQVTPEDFIESGRPSLAPQVPPATRVISQPVPIRVPGSVWPEIQGLIVRRAGAIECGS